MASSSTVSKQQNKKLSNRPEFISLDASTLLTPEAGDVPTQPVRIAQEYCESITVVWCDPGEKSSVNLVGPLRSINDQVLSFTDLTSCLKFLRVSKEKLFFVTSSCDNEFISTVHNLTAVEAIFIVAANVDSIRGDLPKLCGIFSQQEEVLRAVRDTIEVFEQIQLESFDFQDDKMFLWSQIWKEQLISRRLSSTRHSFIEAANHHYRDNVVTLRSIDELNKSYKSTEVIYWCLHSPFPSRFINHALCSHSNEQLNLCRFLFVDAHRLFQQRSKNNKLSEKYYRGMKLSHEIVHAFEAHVGKVMCTNGFFPCAKSRANALAEASMPAYRADLLPVLFKVDCDALAPWIELSNKSSQPAVVFDVCMTFRIVYVQREQITIIKLKTDGEVGKKIAIDYIERHKNESIQSLLDELAKLAVPTTSSALPQVRSQAKTIATSSPKTSKVSEEEMKAQRLMKRGDTDQALAAYQHIEPKNPRILNAMGHLAADTKQDYNFAIKCHQQALKMQEEAGEDISDTLTELANAYFFTNEYDLALSCHTRASTLRQNDDSDMGNSAAAAANLIGIATVHWMRKEYSQAIDYAQRALTIREHMVPPNKLSIGSTLALLGNIYRDAGNVSLALTLSKQALTMLETVLPDVSPVLNDLRYTVGKLYLSTGSLNDAYECLKQVVSIYKKTLPAGHSDLTQAEADLQQVIKLNRGKK